MLTVVLVDYLLPKGGQNKKDALANASANTFFVVFFCCKYTLSPCSV
jgi:hypothetical protein